MSPSMASRTSRLRGWSSTIRTLGFSDTSHPEILSLTVQSHAQQGEELISVDGFRDVVRGARLKTLFAVALHRFRRQRQDWQRPELRLLAYLAHRFVPVHFGHHDIHEHDA